MKMRHKTSLWLSILVVSQAVFAVAADQPKIEDVSFTAKCDNSEQRYVVIWPAGFRADQPHDLLIALHGHGSDRWKYIKDEHPACRAARDVAAARQMIFVSPDYRPMTSWMGPKAEADVVQIIGEFKSRYKIGKTILCGGSMGGSSALTFAVLHPEMLDGVVSMNGTANHFEFEGFQDAIQESFGGTKRQIPLEYKNRSAEYWPERLTMPIAFALGGRDPIVPPQSALRLAGVLKKLNPNVLLIFREAAEHETDYNDGKAVLDFVIDKATRASTDPSPSKKKS